MLGTSNYAIREIGKIRTEKKKLKRFFSEILLIRFANSVIIAIILFFILEYTNVNSYMIGITILYLVLQIGVIDWLFQGIEDVKSITIRILLSKLVMLILIFLFIKSKDEYILYYLLLTIDSAASLVYGLYYVTKNIGFTSKNLNFTRHFRPMFFMFSVQFSISIYTLVDKIMLGALSSNAEVGYYTAALKLVKIFQATITSLGLVLLPRLSYYAQHENQKEYSALINKTLNFVLLTAIPLASGIFLVAEESIVLFAGKDYVNAIIPIRILSLTILIVALGSFFGTQVLLSINREKEFFIAVFIGAAVNITLNFLLIPKYSSIGASTATLFTEFVVALGCFYFAFKNCKALSFPRLNVVLKYLFLSLAFVFAGKMLPGDNLILLFISKILLGAIVYLGGLLLFRDVFFLKMLTSVKNMLLKK